MLGPIHTAWEISISLRAILALVTQYRLFRWYLIFSVVGSLILWMTPDRLYAPLWITKGVILCVLNMALTADAISRLPTRLHRRDVTLCLAASALVFAGLARAPRWPHSALEPAESLMALCSTVLCLFLTVVVFRTMIAEPLAVWHGRILCGYLLLDALCLFPASEASVGVAVGVATSTCYVAWIIAFGAPRVARRRGSGGRR